ncbi:MAG: hypothetical protein AB7J28_15370 [Hyphomonadaceae bacterium]
MAVALPVISFIGSALANPFVRVGIGALMGARNGGGLRGALLGGLGSWAGGALGDALGGALGGLSGGVGNVLGKTAGAATSAGGSGAGAGIGSALGSAAGELGEIVVTGAPKTALQQALTSAGSYAGSGIAANSVKEPSFTERAADQIGGRVGNDIVSRVMSSAFAPDTGGLGPEVMDAGIGEGAQPVGPGAGGVGDLPIESGTSPNIYPWVFDQERAAA